MLDHLGLGPVFWYEWLCVSRQMRFYAIRSLFVASLLIGLYLSWMASGPTEQGSTIQQMASLGSSLYFTIVWTQLTIVLFAAPATTAGAICLDKTRGTLDHVLATDLSNSEIVLGKLGVRLIPIFTLVACAFPVMVLGTLLGGIDPASLVGSFIVTLGVGILSSVLAMMISIWGKKTHEVLLISYMILLAWILLPLFIITLFTRRVANSVWPIVTLSHPYYLVAAPYWRPGHIGFGTWWTFLVICLLISLGMTTLATMKIRTVSLHQAGRSVRGRRLGNRVPRWGRSRWSFRTPYLLGPSIDSNPVLWREWHRNKPSKMMRVTWGIYLLVSLVLGLPALYHADSTMGTSESLCCLFVNVGLVFLTVQASTCLAEERARGNLDILLTTPISTFDILIGKWLGAYKLAPKVMLLPSVIALAIALKSSRWFDAFLYIALIHAYAASATTVGLALATWITGLGRAIATAIAFFVLYNAGVIAMVACVASSGQNSAAIIVSIAGSLYGSVFGAMNVGSHREMVGGVPDILAEWIGLWAFIHFMFAGVLFVGNWRSFGRYLGRDTVYSLRSRRVVQAAAIPACASAASN